MDRQVSDIVRAAPLEHPHISANAIVSLAYVALKVWNPNSNTTAGGILEALIKVLEDANG